MTRDPPRRLMCALCTPVGRDDWETIVVAGALRHVGIESVIWTLGHLPPAEPDVLSIGLSPRFSTRDCRAKGAGGRSVDVLAGRAVTQAHLRGALRPGDDQVLIYGEPYALLVRLATGGLAIDGLRGRAVLGPPFDLAAYATPPGGPLLTSLGCVKACAYCGFGATYRHLYPGFRRRERPWTMVAAEITESVGRGEGAVAFIADQFLAVDPNENAQLVRLAANLNLPGGARPAATFTVAPREVLANQLLVASLNGILETRPTLSIDSLDDVALTSYRVEFEAADALRAASYLTELDVPFRLNYIFARPRMTADALHREFANLHALALITRDRPAADQWLLVKDVFTSRLTPVAGAPLWTDSTGTDADGAGPPELLELVMDGILGVLAREAHDAGTGAPVAPFLAAVEAGLDALHRA